MQFRKNVLFTELSELREFNLSLTLSSGGNTKFHSISFKSLKSHLQDRERDTERESGMERGLDNSGEKLDCASR